MVPEKMHFFRKVCYHIDFSTYLCWLTVQCGLINTNCSVSVDVLNKLGFKTCYFFKAIKWKKTEKIRAPENLAEFLDL